MRTAVAEVVVEPAGAGLWVSWSLEGDDTAVVVGIGPTPDAATERTVTVPAGERGVHLERPDGGRPYVSVAPAGGGPAVVAAERRVPFAGVTNFRDVGGYRTTDGRRVRWGAVYRADGLHSLTADDLVAYRQLGVRTVFDLRGDAERAEHPDPFPAVHLPLITRRPSEEVEGALDRSTLTRADHGEQLLRDVYDGILTTAAPALGELFSTLAGADRRPAVFHCHGGKDRTGVAAALLLELLGVDRETALDDYELTSRYRRTTEQVESFQRLLGSGIAPEAAAAVLGTPRWAMQAALEEMDRAHGGTVGFLTGPAGLAPSVIDALRRQLIS